MTRFQSLLSLALILMIGADGYAQNHPSIPMQRNSYGLYTLETHVGRSVLFSGNPDADPVPFINRHRRFAYGGAATDRSTARRSASNHA